MKNETIINLERMRTALKEEKERVWAGKRDAASLVGHRTDEDIPKIEIYDSNPQSYVNTIKNGIMSAVMPSDDNWFRFTTFGSIYGSERNRRNQYLKGTLMNLDEIPGAMDYFEACTQKILTVCALINYYNEKSIQVADGLVFGFGVGMTVDDVSTGGIIFKTISPLEVLLKLDDSKNIDMYMREIEMKNIDVVAKYGSRAPEKIRKAYDSGNINDKTKIVEAIIPNRYFRSRSGGRMNVTSKPFAYVVYAPDCDEIIIKKGYSEMPLSLWNYEQTTTPYGKGLVEITAPEIVKLYDLNLQRMKMVQYLNDPAWNIPMSLQGKFSAKNRAKNSVTDMGQQPQALQKPNTYNELTNDIIDCRNNLREIMPVDLFKTVLGSTDSRKTAYEVSTVKTEAAQLVTQSIGNLESSVRTDIMRMFRIGIRKRMIQAPDEEIRKLLPFVRIEFDSVFIQRMRSYYMVEGNQSLMNMIVGYYQIDPSILDNIDMDRLIRMQATGMGSSQYAIREQNEVKKIREEKAHMAQQQRELEMQNMQSQTNANNAKAQMV